MSTPLHDRVPRGKIGLLAHVAGFGADECAAIRRHAEREESRGDHAAAAETWRVAAMLEPGEASGWEGLARCLRRLGDTRGARGAEDVASTVKRRFG